MKKISLGLLFNLIVFGAYAQVQPLNTFVFPYGALLCGGGRYTISDCTKLSGPISTPSFPSLINIGSINITNSIAPANGIYLQGTGTLGLISSGSANGLFFGSSNPTIGIGPGNINSTDLFNIRGGSNSAISYSIRNNATGTAAQTQINLANNTSNTEIQMTLNGGGFSGGLGANAFNINAKDGQIVLQTASTSAITISNSQLVALPAIGTDATHTDATVCEDTTTHALFFGSGAAGICLGTSSIRFKHDVITLDKGLDEIIAMKPVEYKLNADKGDPNKSLYGFIAEDNVKILPKLVGYDEKGQVKSFDYMGVVPILVNAIKEQQKQIDELKIKVYAKVKNVHYAKVH